DQSEVGESRESHPHPYQPNPFWVRDTSKAGLKKPRASEPGAFFFLARTAARETLNATERKRQRINQRWRAPQERAVSPRRLHEIVDRRNCVAIRHADGRRRDQFCRRDRAQGDSIPNGYHC